MPYDHDTCWRQDPRKDAGIRQDARTAVAGHIGGISAVRLGVGLSKTADYYALRRPFVGAIDWRNSS